MVINTVEKINTPEKEAEIINKITFVGIFGNILLSIFKLLSGIFGKSSAMISDSIHSLSDVFATFIAYIGVKISKKEPDKNHPYGHDRLECVASLILGVILAIAGLIMGETGFENIFFKDHSMLFTPRIIALVAAVISNVVKELMYRYTFHYAKIINSSAFIADSKHHRSDAFSSFGALFGIVAARYGFVIMDSVMSIVICIFILKMAYDIIKDAIQKMLDTSCDDVFMTNLREFIIRQDGVICVDVLQTRMFGSKVYIDLEIQVDGSIPLREAHAIAENVHRNVEEHFPTIKHIMIHLNPAV